MKSQRWQLRLLFALALAVSSAVYAFAAPPPLTHANHSRLTSKQFADLTPEQRRSVPYRQFMALVGSKLEGPAGLWNRFAAYQVSQYLSDLLYSSTFYDANPWVELEPLIKKFQTSIGATPTGDLLLGQFQELENRAKHALSHRQEILSLKRVIGDNEIVTVKGSWKYKVAGSVPNTSEIECRQATRECIEAYASDAFGGWGVDIQIWRIESWNSGGITARWGARCLDWILIVNRNDNSAMKIRKGTGSKGCGIFNQGTQTLVLVSGTDLYTADEKGKFVNPDVRSLVSK